MNQSDIKPAQHLATASAKPVLFSLLILISGIIIGVGLTRITSRYLKGPRKLPPGPEYMSERMVQRIIRELHLTPEQQQQISPIVTRHMKAIDDIRKEARPKVSQEVKSMNEEILAILDDSQQQLWQNQIQRMQRHFSRMKQYHGPDGKRRRGRGSGPGFGPDEPGRQRRFRGWESPQGPPPPPDKLDEPNQPPPSSP